MILLFTDVSHTPGIGKYAGTYKIATELRKHGYETQVIDCFKYLGLKRLKLVLDKFLNSKTILIGISNTLMYDKKSMWGISNIEFEQFVSYAKTINPKVKFMVGGAGVTKLLSWPYIDFTILNKGDNAIIALADHVTNNTPLKFTQVNNTKLINGDDYFYGQKEFSTSFIRFEENDVILEGEALPIEVARGCIFKCAFCFFDLIGKRIGDWTKTEDTLYKEMMYNYSMFGTTQYMISDELINESIPKLEMLVRLAQRLPFKLEYTAYARIDLIVRYPQMIPLLQASGAVGLSFGIETFTHTAGKAVGKGMHPDRIKDTLEDCKAVWKDNVLISSNFIVGLPGETMQDIKNTVNYLLEENCPIDAFELNLLTIKDDSDGKVGNKMGKDPGKYGYTMDSNKGWISSHIDQNEARLFLNNLKNDPIVKNKRKFMSATYIGRIMSLGYSIQDIFKLMNDQTFLETIQQVNLRTHYKKEEYFKRIMAL